MKPHPTPLLLGEGNTKCGRGFLTRFFCHSERMWRIQENMKQMDSSSSFHSSSEWHFHLTFGSNILQLNCYDIFIFYRVYRNVIIVIRITIILSTYMNQSNLMIIQNFIILPFIISYLVCDQEWILYIIIFRSSILWNQVNSIP